jgi:hypothetical protein
MPGGYGEPTSAARRCEKLTRNQAHPFRIDCSAGHTVWGSAGLRRTPIRQLQYRAVPGTAETKPPVEKKRLASIRHHGLRFPTQLSLFSLLWRPLQIAQSVYRAQEIASVGVAHHHVPQHGAGAATPDHLPHPRMVRTKGVVCAYKNELFVICLLTY